MRDDEMRHRRSSRRLSSSSPSLNLSRGDGAKKARRNPIGRAAAITKMSDSDHDIVHLLAEHRVVTTQQAAVLLQMPERTVRYRLERLEKLRLAGRSRPYVSRGKAPDHWWPTRLADAYARGEPVPRSGERDAPNESFLKHAASLTAIYAGVKALAEAHGLRLSFTRESEGKQEFTYAGSPTSIVPDATVALDSDLEQFEAFIELDMGTAGLPKLRRKLQNFLAYSYKGVWREHHRFLPALVFITTTDRRAEAILKAFESMATDPPVSWLDPFDMQSYTFGICSEARGPERAFTDPVWTKQGGVDGLGFLDLVSEPAERAAELQEERRAEEEQEEKEREEMRRNPEARRRQIHETRYAADSHERNLTGLDREKQALLERLLKGTASMNPEESRAWWFFERRIDPDREPFARSDDALSPDEREALQDLRWHYLEAQKQKIALLFGRYRHLPMLVRAMRRLDSGELLSWSEEASLNDSLRDDLARAKKHEGIKLDYLTWRKKTVVDRKLNMGRFERLLARESEVTRLIDQHLLRYCPECEAISIPTAKGGGDLWPSKNCPFCRQEGKTVMGLEEAIADGYVEEDGEGFYRVCHPPMPQWASSEARRSR